MEDLKECILSVIADYNHLDKELLGDTYDNTSYRTYLIKAVELLFKNEEYDTERANVIREWL